jgi:hypothetical protein
MDSETVAPDTADVVKTPKHRSPNYPAIDLEKAVERTKQLAEIAGRHAAPLSAVLGAWGYTAKSSNGQITHAALKRFGLAEDQGKGPTRLLRLTSLGKELAFYDSDRNAPEWLERVRTAALEPAIHRDIWLKYDGQLPDNSVIRPYLVLQRGFSESAANEVLRILRSTLSFAKIDADSAGASLSADGADNETGSNGIVTPATIDRPKPRESEHRADPLPPDPPAKTAKPQRTVQVPYSPGEWALVQAAFPMTDAAWKQMITVLEAMKPGLVSDE